MPATYLIAHTQRTGSNWLCDVLAHTGVAGINDVNRCGLFVGYGEGLAAQGVYPEKVDEYFHDSTTPNGVCGMKSDWDYLDVLGQYFPVDAVDNILRRFTHFIYLHRQNKLAQSVSWYIAAQSGVFTSTNRGKPDKGDPLAVSYDCLEIDMRLARIEAASKRWMFWFSRNEIDPLFVTYEEMEADMSEAVQRILHFLDVDAVDVPIQYTLQKQVNSLKAEFIARYKAGE